VPSRVRPVSWAHRCAQRGTRSSPEPTVATSALTQTADVPVRRGATRSTGARWPTLLLLLHDRQFYRKRSFYWLSLLSQQWSSECWSSIRYSICCFLSRQDLSRFLTGILASLFISSAENCTQLLVLFMHSSSRLYSFRRLFPFFCGHFSITYSIFLNAGLAVALQSSFILEFASISFLST